MGTASDPGVDATRQLPVPSAEADAVLFVLDDVISLVDAHLLARQSGHANHLASWEGAARLSWDEEFLYSQADGQAVVDVLQALKGAVAGVIDAIDDHNLVAAFIGPMTTSAADPAGLRTYAGRASGARTDIADATANLRTKLAGLAAALPEGYTAPAAPDVAGYLGRVGAIDHYVTEVAAKFEDADRTDDRGRRVVDDTTLASIPLVSQYGEAERLALAARAEDELATLRERLRSGDVDETTLGELVATISLLGHVTDSAPDPQAQAATLIDTMGAGDLHEALRLLEGAADDHGHRARTDWSIAGIASLAHLVSLGLERQPARAARWPDDLIDRRDTYHDPAAADGLVLVAAFTAAGTRTFGAAMHNELDRLGQTSDGGLPQQLFDTRSPVVPIIRNATCNPPLANAIVENLLSQGDTTSAQGHQARAFTQVFSVLGEQDPRYADLAQTELAALLSSSVSPSLDPTTRAATSLHLAQFVANDIDGARPVYGYHEPILQALGATLQPGLEHVHGPTGRLALGSADPDATRLFDAAAYLGTTEGGASGVAQAIDGLVATRIGHAGRPVGATGRDGQPIDLDALDDLSDVLYQLVERTSGRQFREVVGAIEADGWAPTSEALLVGSFELTPAPVIGDVLSAAQAYHGREVANGGSVLPPDLEDRVALNLLAVTVEHRPDLATPHVLEMFERAADHSGAAGVRGLLDTPEAMLALLGDGDTPQDPSTELMALAGLYDEQVLHLNVSPAALVDGVTGAG